MDNPLRARLQVWTTTLKAERTLQLIERSPAPLRVEIHLVGTRRRRSAGLDSIREEVVAYLDVTVPCRRDSFQDPDVALTIRVDRNALLLRHDRPRLREIAPHDPADDESPERLLEPSLALRGTIPDEPFDARHVDHE